MPTRHRFSHLSDIQRPVPPEPGSYDWAAVRRHFDIRSFGVNLFTGLEAGDSVIVEHTEVGESGTRHEELFFVSEGHASFVVSGEEIDAPQGTFVYVPDPGVLRSARAVVAGTRILAIGGEPGAVFTISPWEERYLA